MLVSSNKGYYSRNNLGGRTYIYICPDCTQPTYFTEGKQHPGPLLGRSIKNLPDDISQIYTEMRRSSSEGNFTAVQLLGRKLIMHLSVDVASSKGGQKFAQYIDELKIAGYISPKAEWYVKRIKDIGNDTNHEIILGTSQEAETIINFTEMLLLHMYEFAESEEFDQETA